MKPIAIGLLLVGVAFAAWFFLPFLAPSTNCGGNSYALTVCEEFAVTARAKTQDHEGSFEISKISQQDLAMIARNAWGISGADLLVRTNFLPGSSTNRALVIVCTRKFDNIPQPMIWNLFHKTPAHAVGYSDGEVALISPDDFAKLNLDGFVSAASLVAGSQ